MTNSKKEQENEDKALKDGQYRKSLSIAFFNAINTAIELVKLEDLKTDEDKKDRLVFWRNWLLQEHRSYHTTVISRVGINYDPKVTIEKIKKTTNLDQLKAVFLSLYEDERRDPDILKVVHALKKKYEAI